MILHYLQGCFGFRKSDASIAKYFNKREIPFNIGYYKVKHRWIRYVETGDNTKPLVLFVHGAPGSASSFIHFLSDHTLLSQVHMISVDRPGFGYSGFGKAVISLEQQCAMIRPLLKNKQSEKLPILVGHSYGATLIARFAMDYPKEVGILLMVAPAVDPRLEKIFPVSYPADMMMFKWLMPTCLRVTNEEKLGHVAQLHRMLPFWENIVAPVTIIHGIKDILASVENADFVKKLAKNAHVRLITEPGLNHLIPWEHPDLMINAIKTYLQEVSSS